MTPVRRALLGAAVIAGALAPFARQTHSVSPVDLATWIKDRKPGLRVVDTRPKPQFDEFHIPQSEHLELAALEATRFTPTDTVVLISPLPRNVELSAGHTYVLRGGVDGWIAEVTRPPKPTALSRYFGRPRRGGC